MRHHSTRSPKIIHEDDCTCGSHDWRRSKRRREMLKRAWPPEASPMRAKCHWLAYQVSEICGESGQCQKFPETTAFPKAIRQICIQWTKCRLARNMSKPPKEFQGLDTKASQQPASMGVAGFRPK